MLHARPLTVLAAAICVGACTPGPATSPPAATTAPAAEPVAEAAPAPAAAPDLAATLLAHHWELTTATDAAGQTVADFFPVPDRKLGLDFQEGRLGVTGGCNRLFAAFRIAAAGQLELTPGPSTMMACPPPLASADAAMAKFLTGTVQAEVAGEASAPVLRLAAADGTTLTLQGTPTPETRFGGPGARAFLEVSHDRCPAPHDADPSCLMVRDRHFDEQGLEGEPGEWRALPGGIEGYTLPANEKQVVRVKRFDVADPAGGAPTSHYVFDMVVRSEVIR